MSGHLSGLYVFEAQTKKSKSKANQGFQFHFAINLNTRKPLLLKSHSPLEQIQGIFVLLLCFLGFSSIFRFGINVDLYYRLKKKKKMATVPGPLVWEIVKRNNSFLVKEFGNNTQSVQFSREPNNLYNLNSYKYSGKLVSKSYLYLI